MKVVAVIPARAGSKGIPNKNLVEVAGKPLISWSIEAAINASSIDRILVTSDGDEILNIANQYNEVISIKRPRELAEDQTPTAPVVIHALEEIKALKNGFDYLILLQPTSPLRTEEEIEEAFEVLKNSNGNALVSVVKPSHHPLKSFKRSEQGYLKGLVNNEFPFMPRQELPEVFQPNGAIYIIEIKEFLKKKTFFTNKTIHYEMSAEKSIDVDSYDDIIKIENQLKTNPPC